MCSQCTSVREAAGERSPDLDLTTHGVGRGVARADGARLGPHGPIVEAWLDGLESPYHVGVRHPRVVTRPSLITLLALLVVGALAGDIAVEAVGQESAGTPSDDERFVAVAGAANRLDADRRAATDPERRAALTVDWLRALQHVGESIPFGQAERDPYRAWLADHREEVAYSEPAGQWLLASRVAWRAHDEFRDTSRADDLAWLAATNGLPGECEGFVACYLQVADMSRGAYLRRRPSGGHVDAALTYLAVTVGGAFELMTRPDGGSYFDPSRDCREVLATADALRAAVAGAASEERNGLVFLIDQLRRRCVAVQ
jgi:hypothetical protein